MLQSKLSQLFDTLAPSYERVNKAISLRQNLRWNSLLVNRILSDHHILDLCCGTALVTRTLLSSQNNATSIDCLDISSKMLAQAKLDMPQTNIPIRYLCANALKIPAPDESYDAVVVAYGLRNIVDTDGTLREVYRVLKPNGFCHVLELCSPSNPICGLLHFAYLYSAAPLLAYLISGHYAPYLYLASSIRKFSVSRLLNAFTDKGFSLSNISLFSLGAVIIFSAQRPHTEFIDTV